MNTPTNTMQDHASDIPRARSGIPWFGHIISFVVHPQKFLRRLAETYGEIVSFTLLGHEIVLLTGNEASELFYLSPEDQLDQSAMSAVMTPIFGKGVYFDASIERKNEQLRAISPALRMEAMRNHSHTIIQEVKTMIADWGDEGEFDLLDFMRQLIINASSHCLLGKEFRYELSGEFACAYRDLKQGIVPLDYFLPHLPIPRFKRRDRARCRLQKLISGTIDKRAVMEEKPFDLLQFLIDTRHKDGIKLTDNEITGILIAAFMGGHDTNSGTATWMLLELLKHPCVLRKTCEEVDLLPGGDEELTFDTLRDMPYLENVLKEVLRLHPPILIMMRQALQDIHFKRYMIKANSMTWICPTVTHRLAELFPNPQTFDPDRFGPTRREDRTIAYQPFGGGKHKCRGNVFATFQIKAIFAVLLRHYEFELVAAPETYVDDYTQVIVQPKTPCLVRYRRRASPVRTTLSHPMATHYANAKTCPFHQ